MDIIEGDFQDEFEDSLDKKHQKLIKDSQRHLTNLLSVKSVDSDLFDRVDHIQNALIFLLDKVINP